MSMMSSQQCMCLFRLRFESQTFGPSRSIIINKKICLKQFASISRSRLCGMGGSAVNKDFIHSGKMRSHVSICASVSPRWNPQNTDQPLVLPSPEHSAEETVTIQLDALSKCDDPWPNHGLQLAYEFGYDIGGLDPSMYFGHRNDLYHQDHFMGKFQTKLPELVNLKEFTIESVSQNVVTQSDEPSREIEEWVVEVAVMPAVGVSRKKFAFYLRRKPFGSRKGSLMTAMVIRLDS